jgi:hypothetical protein
VIGQYAWVRRRWLVLVVGASVCIVGCAGVNGHPDVVSPPTQGTARSLTPYRWHSVSQRSSDVREITTIDGVADPAHHRYSMHIHSSVGTAAGGNLVMSDGTWFQEDRNGRSCIWRRPANEINQGNEDLTQAGLDPTHWLSTLRDGDTSPTISISRFFAFPTNLTAKVHRQRDTLSVEFIARPGVAADLVLRFTDFGRTPTVTVPNATKECPYTPSGD